MIEKIDILGVKITPTNLPSACQTIEEWIQVGAPKYICVVPVATIVECQSNENFRRIVNRADMATPDGMPVVWLGKLAGHKTIDRTYGPDLMREVCRLSAKKGYKIYLYGATEPTCRRLELKLLEQFPHLNIVGRFSPPFRPLSDEENDQVLSKINQADPDILWIGLGSPKQDYWMSDYRARLKVPVMVGVGAAFDFLSGAKRQAPAWMQRSGLEWFFRLCCEPRRLWKRYLLGNTKFIYFLLRERIK